MKKEQIKYLRVVLLAIWTIVFSLLLLLGGCTAGMLGEEPGEQPVSGSKSVVSFAPLVVVGEVQTRAAESVMESGTLRLLVYEKSASLSTTPIANRTYTVTKGVLKEADGGGPLELYSGSYQFYALSPSSINPVAGKASGIQQGDDPLASLTEVTALPAGTKVTLSPLSHKASKISFAVSKAVGATFVSMETPSLLTLYSQATQPASLQLGAGGGSLTAVAGTSTVVLGGTGNAFTRPDAGKEEYYVEHVVLPKPSGAFNVAIQTRLVLKAGAQPVAYTLRAKVPACTLEAGKMYNFRIRVKNPRELGDVALKVTDWSDYTWEDYPY